MTLPLLMLSPNESRDGNGPVSLTSSGPVRTLSYDNAQAWLIEEGTINYVANPHTVAFTNISMWAGASGSIVTDQTDLGPNVLRTVCDGSSAGQGPSHDSLNSLGFTGSARTFAGSVYAKGSGTIYIYLRVHYTSGSVESSRTTVTLTNTPTRYFTPTVTVASGSTVNNILVMVNTVTPQAVTYYTTRAQIEEKPYATSFCPELSGSSPASGYSWNGTPNQSASTRANASLSMPSSVISPVLGSAYVRYGLTSSIVKERWLFDLGGLGGGVGTQLSVMSQSLSNSRPRMRRSNTYDILAGINLPSQGPRTAYVEWKSDGFTLANWYSGNGNQSITQGPFTNMSAWAGNLFLGWSGQVSYYGSLNDPLSMILFFPRQLTTQEIAKLDAIPTNKLSWYSLVPTMGGMAKSGFLEPNAVSKTNEYTSPILIEN